MYVARIRRKGEIIEPRLEDALQADDVVALFGRRALFVHPDNPLQGHETDDRDLLDFPTASVDVVVTSKRLAGRALGDVARDASIRGVFLAKLVRNEQELPFTLQTVIDRGDILYVL